MSIIKTGISAHDTTTNTAEMTRQVADDKAKATFLAAGGGPAAQPAYDAALKTNSITYYRAVVASCVANGLPAGNFAQALRDLGTGGV
jgi:hypothetical protein